jgi:YtkA-like
MKTWTGWVVAALVAIGSASVIAEQAKSPAKRGKSAVTITFASRPSPPKAGENQFDVTVKGADGKPVTDADVAVSFVMPAMPAMKMAEMRSDVKLKPAGAGKYAGSGQVPTAGTWNVTVSVKQSGKELGQKKLKVTAK